MMRHPIAFTALILCLALTGHLVNKAIANTAATVLQVQALHN